MSPLHALALSARTASLLIAPNGACHSLPDPQPWRLISDDNCVQSGVATTVGLFLDGLRPNTGYRLETALGELAFTTRPCAGLVEASDFGVDPGKADNCLALANAVAAVPPGGTLRLGPGVYHSRPIFLKPQMTLLLEEGAVLAAVSDRANWPILLAYGDDRRVLATWEGLPENSFAALVSAVDCHGLQITGRGVIDGGGDRGDWWQWPKETRQGARRPRTLSLLYCSDVQLTGVTVRNSPSWTVHPYRCNRLHVSNVVIENPADSPNTDGLNPESCIDTEIIATRFTVGDDCIAIKAGKRSDQGDGTHLAPTQGVTIRHCLMQRGHGAVVIGSEMSGDITGVSVHCCEFDATDRGLRIKTRRGRGGKVADIRMTDTVMRGVATPIAVNAFYFCDHDGKSDRVQTRHPAAVETGTPVIEGITCERITATGAVTCAAALLGLPEAPIRQVRICDLQVSYVPEVKPEVPLMALGVPALRHGGILAENVELFSDSEVKSFKGELKTC